MLRPDGRGRPQQASGGWRRGILLLAALAFSLWMTLGAAGAEARALTLTGGVIGDSNATVTARLVKRRGTPSVIKWVVFRKLDHSCQDGSTRELNVVLKRSRIERIGRTGRFTFFEILMPRSGLPAPNDRNQLAVTGKMRRSGRRVTGTVDSTVRFAPVPPARANACLAEHLRYVLRRARR
jgi:hypothetical protein